MTPQEKWKKDRKARWIFLSLLGGLRRARMLFTSIESSEFTSPNTKRLAGLTAHHLSILEQAFNEDLRNLKGKAE